MEKSKRSASVKATATIDTTLVENILHYSEQYSDRLETRARQISGIDNPSSFQQIRKWLRSKHLDPPSLDKDGVKQLISECRESEPDVVEFMQIRQELGKTSVAKYDAMARALCHDKRIRGMLQFYGAERTGRWAGRIVQLQNLPQNKLKDLDLVHQIVRNGDFDLLEILYESPIRGRQRTPLHRQIEFDLSYKRKRLLLRNRKAPVIKKK